MTHNVTIYARPSIGQTSELVVRFNEHPDIDGIDFSDDGFYDILCVIMSHLRKKPIWGRYITILIACEDATRDFYTSFMERLGVCGISPLKNATGYNKDVFVNCMIQKYPELMV